MYSRNALEGNTKDELTTLALAEFGMELKPAMAKSEMVEAIIAAQGGELEMQGEPVGGETEAAAVSTPASAGAGERKYRVTVFEAKDEPAFVDLSVNGDAIRVKRGVEVVIAERFVNVLRNAVQTVHEGVEQADGKVSMVEKNVPRFAYSAEAV